MSEGSDEDEDQEKSRPARTALSSAQGLKPGEFHRPPPTFSERPIARYEPTFELEDEEPLAEDLTEDPTEAAPPLEPPVPLTPPPPPSGLDTTISERPIPRYEPTFELSDEPLTADATIDEGPAVHEAPTGAASTAETPTDDAPAHETLAGALPEVPDDISTLDDLPRDETEVFLDTPLPPRPTGSVTAGNPEEAPPPVIPPRPAVPLPGRVDLPEAARYEPAFDLEKELETLRTPAPPDLETPAPPGAAPPEAEPPGYMEPAAETPGSETPAAAPPMEPPDSELPYDQEPYTTDEPPETTPEATPPKWSPLRPTGPAPVTRPPEPGRPWERLARRLGPTGLFVLAVGAALVLLLGLWVLRQVMSGDGNGSEGAPTPVRQGAENDIGIGSWAEIGGGWHLAVTEVTLDADVQLSRGALGRVPVNGGYILATVEMEYLGEDPTTMLDLALDATVPPNTIGYESRDCRATLAQPLDLTADVFPGARAQAQICFDVRPQDRPVLALAAAAGSGEATLFSFTTDAARPAPPPELPPADIPLAPFPLKTAVDIGGDWWLRVDSVDRDAEEELRQNQFNDRPTRGGYVMARITVTYRGRGTVNTTDLRLNAIGASRVGYSSASCAAIEPEPFPWSEEARRGMVISGDVCFDLPKADAEELLLYARVGSGGAHVFFKTA